MRKIIVSDKTLCSNIGEKANSLLFREKIAIAKKLDELDVDRIELPYIIKEKEDKIIAKTISMSIKKSSIVIPCLLSKKSVDDAVECITDNDKTVISITVPVSTVTMEYEYHKKDNGMLDLVKDVFSYAKSKCENIEFVAKDATRAEKDFLKKCITVATDCGAKSVTLCDDAGVYMPSEWEDLVKNIKEYCDAKIFVQINNKLKMGVASAVSSIISGADGVKTSMLKSNDLNITDFANAIDVKGESLGIETNLRTERLKTDVRSTVKEINNNKDDSVDGLVVSDKYFYITKDTTLDEISSYVSDLGYSISAEDISEVYKAVENICEKKNSISTKEFEAIIASHADQVPSTYHLESYNANCGNLSSSIVHIVLKSQNDILNGVSIGDGPIDAAFMAIEQCIGHHYELDSFQIEAVTEGKEALGSAIVRLRDNGNLYSGNGVSSDIVGASIRAYLNALNKIVAKEEKYEA